MAPDTLQDVIQTSDLPDTMRAVYSAELEMTTRGNVIYDQFAERKNDFAGNKGTSVVWTVYQNLPPSIRPLVEDQDVGGMAISDFQVSLTIEEYGMAIGTTEKLNLTSHHGPISSLVRTMLGPQLALTTDLLARNAMIGSKASYRSFAGGRANRAAITSADVMTSQIARAAAYNLGLRRIPPTPQGYIALVHPAQIYDLKLDPFWIDVLKYTQPETILNGEVGKIHGVRFVEANNARLPNAGAQIHQTTLAGDAIANRDFITLAAVPASFVPGAEITIHRYNAAPDGTDETEEHVVIKSVTGTRVYLRAKLTLAHAAGDYVTNGLDIFPTVFQGAVRGLGRGAVLEPEVRVALPTDKLRRQWHVGWYSLMGYGIIRDWALEVVEMTSSVSSAPAFPW